MYSSIPIMPLQLFSIFLLLLPAAFSAAKHGCQDMCGNLSIPYPFGVGSDCSLEPSFNISCDTSSIPPKAYLSIIDKEVIEITESFVVVKYPNLVSVCYEGGNASYNHSMSVNLSGTKYTVSVWNRVTAIGCDDMVLGIEQSDSDGSNYVIGGCSALCMDKNDTTGVGYCPIDETSLSNGCCQASISGDMSWRTDCKIFLGTLKGQARRSAEALASSDQDTSQSLPEQTRRKEPVSGAGRGIPGASTSSPPDSKEVSSGRVITGLAPSSPDPISHLVSDPMSFLLSSEQPAGEIETVELDTSPVSDSVPADISEGGLITRRKRSRENREKLLALAERKRQRALSKTTVPDAILEDAEEDMPTEDMPSRSGGPDAETRTLLPIDSSVATSSVLNLKGRALRDAVHSRIHADDRAGVRKLKGNYLAESLGRLWLTSGPRLEEAMRRIEDYDEVKDTLKKTREASDQREQELTLITAKYSTTDTELSALKARLAELEVEKASLDSELVRMKKESHEKIVRFKTTYAQQYKEAKRRWQTSRDSAYREGFLDGARDQRLEYLLSPHGHQFLRILFEGTLRAYRFTPKFLRGFAPLFAHLIAMIGRKAAELVGASSEQIESLDLDVLMDNINDEEIFAILGIEASAPPSPAWWYPVLDKAAQQFAFGVCDEPLPSNPLYRSPFLQVLQEFVDKLRGPGLNPDACPRQFEAYGMAPPRPASVTAAGASLSEEALLQQFMAFYQDGTAVSRQIVQSMIHVPAAYLEAASPDLEILNGDQPHATSDSANPSN